ncbi:MAG: hypothetical protein JWM68_4783 [Verrucomicrobiales bacterium]|nr:hypothetical protein [Verrucomicrobiales bacterium]
MTRHYLFDMSYDLYFTSPPITSEQFGAYFSERSLYTIGNGQAWYANEDTGVYFSFDHNDDRTADEESVKHSVVFTMNLYRPHYFALEAESEVSNFVQRFGCSIHDPQRTGMEDAPYTAEGFILAWNHSNEFGYRAILHSDSASDVVHVFATNALEKIWHWNYFRQERDEIIAKDIFIPRIMFIQHNGLVCSSCVWPDGITTLIPEVDFLLIPRRDLAPKTFFSGTKEDMCIIPFSEAVATIGQYQVEGYEFNAYELPSPETTRPIKEFVRQLKPNDAVPPAAIAMDQVLNRELVEKPRKG